MKNPSAFFIKLFFALFLDLLSLLYLAIELMVLIVEKGSFLIDNCSVFAGRRRNRSYSSATPSGLLFGPTGRNV